MRRVMKGQRAGQREGEETEGKWEMREMVGNVSCCEMALLTVQSYRALRNIIWRKCVSLQDKPGGSNTSHQYMREKQTELKKGLYGFSTSQQWQGFVYPTLSATKAPPWKSLKDSNHNGVNTRAIGVRVTRVHLNKIGPDWNISCVSYFDRMGACCPPCVLSSRILQLPVMEGRKGERRGRKRKGGGGSNDHTFCTIDYAVKRAERSDTGTLSLRSYIKSNKGLKWQKRQSTVARRTQGRRQAPNLSHLSGIS